jgi:Secretion system C-terminal sorting domain
MKKINNTRRWKQFRLWVLCVLMGLSTHAQPDYVFVNGVLESGIDLQVGAVYRFSNVKPGIDGIITILDITGGMTLNMLDGPSGFDEAFQPYINCPPQSTGYVEFRLDMVSSGTNTQVVVSELPLTAIDIDGWAFPDDKLFETDAFMTTPEFFLEYDLLGNNLRLDYTTGWVHATNISAITYDGIDTIQRDVMVGAIHANVSSVIFRVGAENRSVNSMTRLRSIYFKRFYFAAGVLPESAIRSFQGYRRGNDVLVEWKLGGVSPVRSVALEKSLDGRSFTSIRSLSIDAEDHSLSAQYEDRNTTGRVFYRLRVENMAGNPEYSRVLTFQGTGPVTGLKLYPSIVQSSVSVQVSAEEAGEAGISVYDMAGHLVQSRRLKLYAGQNQLMIDGLERLQRGAYVVQVRTGEQTTSGRIIKQ